MVCRLGVQFLIITFPLIISQFWARQSIVLAVDEFGVDSLNAIGLMRGIQIGLAVLVGLAMRPAISSQFASVLNGPEKKDLT